MKINIAAAATLAVTATSALADDITHLNLGARMLNGETSRDGVDGSFDGYGQIYGDVAYDKGDFTLFGHLDFNRGDFGATGASGENIYERFIEGGAQYNFGTFALGAVLSNNNIRSQFTDTNLQAGTVYGQYQENGLIAGVGVFEFRSTQTDFDDTDAIIFASYEMDNGLLVGAGTFEIDERFTYAFADYEAGQIDVTFDLIDSETETFASIEGNYDFANNFSLIAGIADLHRDIGDGTNEAYIGGQYEMSTGVAAHVALHRFDAFNDFDGSGISVGITYEIGRRKGGMQSVGKVTNKGLSNIFYTF